MRAALAAALLAASAGMAVAAESLPRFQQDRFGIGLWCGPPAGEQNEARYREIAEAGFTFVIGGGGGSAPEAVRRELDLCAGQGLKAIVPLGEQPEVAAAHEACWGFILRDEPNARDFPGLAEQVRALRERCPGRLAYVNLFPNYASREQLGTESYEEHVGRFMAEVDPDVLSMDHYPLMTPKQDGREAYCENLEVMRRHSLAKGVPFWNFFNTMPYGPHRDPTEAQLRWQVHASLAYGAKGVMYFCYWTPRGEEFPKGGAILRADGTRTRHYAEAQRINAGLRRWGPTLMQLRSTGVLRIPAGGNATAMLAGTPVAALSEDNYLVGFFEHADGRRAVLLVNHDIAYAVWPTIAFRDEGVLEVSAATGEAAPPVDESPDMPGLQVPMDAGAARLFLLPAGA
jgi:hypothetical protein